MTEMKIETCVCLLAFLGATCLGHPLLKEKRSLLTREAQEFPTGKISCMAKIFACPKTPVYVLKNGNPLKGEEFFRDGFFTDGCRYIKELNQCIDDNSDMIGRDPECAEMRIVASIVSNQINKMCDSPLLQMLKELRTCFNSRYEDLVDFMKRYEAMSEQSADEGDVCSLYRQLVDDTVTLFKTCPNTLSLWTTENEERFKENFYPGLFRRPNSFTCDRK
uniref:Uncharacterized protein LOC111118400 n=1 Tax=Crassostrea virginica TaxID=6565 RepID=A0A8B8CD45_CRAVI|nr:uncharacterized protein LOC111118400 [Crassostrea virginica]